MTGVQQSADVAVAPGKPTCFHLVDPQQTSGTPESGRSTLLVKIDHPQTPQDRKTAKEGRQSEVEESHFATGRAREILADPDQSPKEEVGVAIEVACEKHHAPCPDVGAERKLIHTGPLLVRCWPENEASSQ